MWLCHTDFPSAALFWASPHDQTGKYGLTHVTCKPVAFGRGTGRPYGFINDLKKIYDLVKRELPPEVP